MAGLVTLADRVDTADSAAATVAADSAVADTVAADLAAAADSAVAVVVAGDAAGLSVHGSGERQQPRGGPQVLLPKATGQHLLAEDAVQLLP
jgi:hypothetical protein